tara:strand:+ start:7834 stop:8157 length:324 start_codon:yes stop_codon:yes gene_type:complete
MNIPSNENINLKKFQYQLCNWLPFQELKYIADTIRDTDGRKCYGKSFVIKQSNRRGEKDKYAVFTDGRFIETHAEHVKHQRSNKIPEEKLEGEALYVNLYRNIRRKA